MGYNFQDEMFFQLYQALPWFRRVIHNTFVSVPKSVPEALNTFLDFEMFCVLVPENVIIPPKKYNVHVIYSHFL